MLSQKIALSVPRLISPIGNASVPEYIGLVIKAILGVVGVVALVMFLWGGFLYLTSGGKPEKIQTGQRTLVWTAIGILMVFAAYAAVNFVISALSA